MFSSSTTLNCKALSHNLITWNGTNNRQLGPDVQPCKLIVRLLYLQPCPSVNEEMITYI